MQHCKITDPGLEHFKGRTNLTYQDLRLCENLTDAVVEKLKQSLPNTRNRFS